MKPIKIFDVILHPRLEKRWIHFDLEAKDEKGKKYYHRSSSGYWIDPPYPAFPCEAGKHHFTGSRYGYKLDSLNINKMIERCGSYDWEAAIKSIKFSDQVYVCPKSYIVWQFAKEHIEGTNYFKIKELPKNREEFYTCDDQYYDVYRLFEKDYE